MFIFPSNNIDIANSQNKSLFKKLQMECSDTIEKEKRKDLQNWNMVKVKRYISQKGHHRINL